MGDIVRCMFAAQPIGRILLLVSLLAISSSISLGQIASNGIPDFVPSVSFSEVLKGLADESISSLFDRNRDLSKAVDDRGVGFALSANTRSVLISAGAKEGLLSAIERKQKKRSTEIIRLYKEYLEVFYERIRDIENRRKVIALGRELLDKIGDPDLLLGEERELREMVTYLKEALPKMEASLKNKLERQPS